MSRSSPLQTTAIDPKATTAPVSIMAVGGRSFKIQSLIIFSLPVGFELFHMDIVVSI